MRDVFDEGSGLDSRNGRASQQGHVDLSHDCISTPCSDGAVVPTRPNSQIKPISPNPFQQSSLCKQLARQRIRANRSTRSNRPIFLRQSFRVGPVCPFVPTLRSRIGPIREGCDPQSDGARASLRPESQPDWPLQSRIYSCRTRLCVERWWVEARSMMM